MVNKFNFLKTFMIFLILIFLMQNLLALGVTPGRTTIDFSPNLEREVKFTIINTENKDMNVAFSVDGELAKYIEIQKDIVTFDSSEYSKDFKYKLTLPRGLTPGLHKARVVALELPPNLEESGTVLVATVSVVTQVYVHVPYPGKYIEASLDIVNSKEINNLINFYIPFISRGKEAIEKVNATIDVYKNQEKISSLITDSLSVNAGQRRELKALWSPDVLPGEYNAIANINYDGSDLIIEKKFNVGPEDLDLLGISVNNFRLGDIAKIKILVQNKLSDAVEEVFASLKIYDSEISDVANLKSDRYNIPSLSNKEIIVYWDTETVEEGQYGSELNIDYNERFINRNFKVGVAKDSMSFSGIGFVISSETDSKANILTFLLMVIGFLLLINIIWFIIWKRHKKK